MNIIFHFCDRFREISTIVRSLGLNPTTVQLESLQQSITSAVAAAAEASGGGAAPTSACNNSSNYVALEQCESLIATWMLEMKDSLGRDDFHVLMRAFQALDPDKRYVQHKCRHVHVSLAPSAC
jgi:hypothetical protein